MENRIATMTRSQASVLSTNRVVRNTYMLLSLTLATLAVYREERGAEAVALLDDVDSELDDCRGHAFCARVSERGQALVTTAHPAWANALPSGAAVFAVAAGEVRPA